jgi:hypothetical protein
MKKKIRVAIITDKKKCSLWKYLMISELKNSYFSEIVLNIKTKEENKNKLPVFWKLFLKVDNFLFNPSHNALLKKNLNELLTNTPILKFNKNLGSVVLKDYEIDVVINFSKINPPEYIINSSKHGLWFLNHCDLDIINKRPYAIWEILNKSPETTALLRYIKNHKLSPVTIDQTSVCTDKLSYKRNLNSILWQSYPLIVNNMKLLFTNEELFNKKMQEKEKAHSDLNISPPFLPPSNARILQHMVILYYKKSLQLLKSIFYFNQWIIIFNNKKDSNEYCLNQYKRIIPPKDRFWADPFIVKTNDKYYLFLEELIYKNKLGHLSVMEIDENGNYNNPIKILEKNYHLSYPFIFKEKDEFYMIPETSGNNNIQLYKCVSFPLKWELEKILMNDVIAVDTTIHKDNDTYWMFTNLKKQKGGSKNVELFLFSSKNLSSDDWLPHQLNPIITDVKKARPAGALFIKDNKLFRPSQNCSNYYGYGLNISEITKLSNTGFSEKTIHSILPNWKEDVIATHTFNSVDNLFVSDIKIKRRRFF